MCEYTTLRSLLPRWWKLFFLAIGTFLDLIKILQCCENFQEISLQHESCEKSNIEVIYIHFHLHWCEKWSHCDSKDILQITYCSTCLVKTWVISLTLSYHLTFDIESINRVFIKGLIWVKFKLNRKKRYKYICYLLPLIPRWTLDFGLQ